MTAPVRRPLATAPPGAVLLVRQHRFRPNPETATDNAFQAPARAPDDVLARRAVGEVTALAEALDGAGVDVHLVEDHDGSRPDSVFPNNWFTTHEDGTLVLHPMAAPSRRAERREDVLALLRERHAVRRVLDLSPLERRGLYLEGTGAMVLDRVARVAYVCRSRRAAPEAVAWYCAELGYEPLFFDAVGPGGQAVYHTNVMLCVARDLVLAGLAAIPDDAQRRRVRDHLGATGRPVLELGADQLASFAGNVIELQGREGPFLAMSTTALAALEPAQRRLVEGRYPIVAVPVPTIELAGGSVRCMTADLHLPRGPAPAEGAGVAAVAGAGVVASAEVPALAGTRAALLKQRSGGAAGLTVGSLGPGR